jgi:glycosyltransferase involved in cell wall biosynthesis
MTAPKAALCVPCFNAAPFLPALAASIRAQTQPFDEIILYDDASTDDSVHVAKAQGVFTTLLRGDENVGPGLARNRCLEAATAPWIHFHDADDLLAPNYLERVRQSSDTFDVVLVNGADFVGDPTKGLTAGANYSDLDRTDVLAYTLTHVLGGIYGFYRRSALEAVGGFAPDLHRLGNEDPDLHVRLAASGARFCALDEVLVYRRTGAGGFSETRRRDCLRGAIVCASRYLATLDERYAPLVLSGLAGIARECDNCGFHDDGTRAWTILRERGHHDFPTSNPWARRLARVLGASVASALRNGAIRVAWSRARIGRGR